MLMGYRSEGDVKRTAKRTGRRWAAVAVSAGLLLTAAACGGDDEGDGGATAEPAATTEPAATSSPGAGSEAIDTFPVSVDHEFGTTEIPAEPQRVVSVGLTEQDMLLALGVVPVGVTEWYGEHPSAAWPWAVDALGDAQPTVLVNDDGFDFEGIAALEPDLIIGTNAGIDQASYEQLSAIAPTVAQPKGADSYFSRWDDQSLLIGQAVGRSAAAQALIDGVHAQFAAAAAEHPEFAEASVVFLQNAFYEAQAIAYQDGLSTAFLTDLGFTIPPSLDPFGGEDLAGQAHIPLENLSVLNDGDVLLWATEAPEDRTALEAEPLYQALEAVQDGRLVFTDAVTAGAIYFTSVLSLPYVIDKLVPALAAALAGEGPQTITG
jgi:iron complex transport system substrate-binding protein